MNEKEAVQLLLDPKIATMVGCTRVDLFRYKGITPRWIHLYGHRTEGTFPRHRGTMIATKVAFSEILGRPRAEAIELIREAWNTYGMVA